MLKRILIANRGEIACRIIATAKAMGMHTIAVYSDADKDAQHVKLADSAYRLGPAPSKESYLNIDKLFEVIAASNADCVHPGYGFLSENEAFAQRCEQNKVTFIGPPASSIEAMGSKTRAKEIMASADVPLVPGYYGKNQDSQFLAEQAAQVGYPVLIKAAYGGGGKGMRVVRNEADFQAGLDGAKREAISSFGNDLVLIERYVDNPRHVEVQVFADKHGNCVYLGDRDCSLQRRHQKVIEEAPAPGLSDELRKRMGEAAVRCAQAINYVGAGTVEFLLCGDEFFFMEMNTRLQVEHPVTEMVTGVDLVKWQIQVASGTELPLNQEQISLDGHSFEARIYAEDTAAGFIPSSGRLTTLKFATANDFVRIDTGVRCNDEISSFYDPMIAKLIVKGDSREHALMLLDKALSETAISGVHANIGFLRRLAQADVFVAAKMDTHFIDDNTEELIAPTSLTDSALAIAAWAYHASLQSKCDSNPWSRLSGFKLNSDNEVVIPLNDHHIVLHIGSEATSIDINGKHYSLAAQLDNDSIIVVLDGQRFEGVAHVNEEYIDVMEQGEQFTLPLKSKHYIGEQQAGNDALAAPMNGTVVKHLLSVGETVKQGDAVVVMEAMKMEYTLNAPFDGVLSQYNFGEGELVSHGDLLANVEEQA